MKSFEFSLTVEIFIFKFLNISLFWSQ